MIMIIKRCSLLWPEWSSSPPWARWVCSTSRWSSPLHISWCSSAYSDCLSSERLFSFLYPNQILDDKQHRQNCAESIFCFFSYCCVIISMQTLDQIVTLLHLFQIDIFIREGFKNKKNKKYGIFHNRAGGVYPIPHFFFIYFLIVK